MEIFGYTVELWHAVTLVAFIIAILTAYRAGGNQTPTSYKTKPKKWKEFSYRLRSQKNWTCENCGIYLPPKKIQALTKPMNYYLHVHHVDRDTFSNQKTNHLVLCQRCHQTQHPRRALLDSEFERHHEKHHCANPGASRNSW